MGNGAFVRGISYRKIWLFKLVYHYINMGLAVTCLWNQVWEKQKPITLLKDVRRLGDHSDVYLTKQHPAPSPFLSILARLYLFESIASSLCWVCWYGGCSLHPQPSCLDIGTLEHWTLPVPVNPERTVHRCASLEFPTAAGWRWILEAVRSQADLVACLLSSTTGLVTTCVENNNPRRYWDLLGTWGKDGKGIHTNGFRMF